MAGMLCPTRFIIDYHFKNRKVVGKRFEEELGMEDLVFADMSRSYVIFSKLPVHRFAGNNNEYNIIG